MQFSQINFVLKNVESISVSYDWSKDWNGQRLYFLVQTKKIFSSDNERTGSPGVGFFQYIYSMSVSAK